MMLAKIENKDTQSVITALVKQARKLPKELYISLTWDRGSEMAAHLTFTWATKIDVYFCDPQSPSRQIALQSPAGQCMVSGARFPHLRHSA